LCPMTLHQFHGWILSLVRGRLHDSDRRWKRRSTKRKLVSHADLLVLKRNRKTERMRLDSRLICCRNATHEKTAILYQICTSKFQCRNPRLFSTRLYIHTNLRRHRDITREPWNIQINFIRAILIIKSNQLTAQARFYEYTTNSAKWTALYSCSRGIRYLAKSWTRGPSMNMREMDHQLNWGFVSALSLSRHGGSAVQKLRPRSSSKRKFHLVYNALVAERAQDRIH
jgi:hypothetical protein